jgi:REase_DpnII-MboI
MRVGRIEEIEKLIVGSRDLDRRAAEIQGDRELLVGRDEIDQLADDYNHWYARAMAVLPEEQHAEFKDLYEGGMVVKRIKTFLASPGEVNTLFDPEAEVHVFGYWQHPYETTFHSSLMEQRQALALARQTIEAAAEEAEVTLVERIGRGLPRMIASMCRRGRERSPLVVTDEYDVQYLLEGVLRNLFDDVRPEDPSPNRAGASTRIDFVLKHEQIFVEAKMTRDRLGEREVADALIDDIERYRAHPDLRTLVAIVYDPDRRIANPSGLENDLRQDSPELRVRVVVCS